MYMFTRMYTYAVCLFVTYIDLHIIFRQATPEVTQGPSNENRRLAY